MVSEIVNPGPTVAIRGPPAPSPDGTSAAPSAATTERRNSFRIRELSTCRIRDRFYLRAQFGAELLGERRDDPLPQHRGVLVGERALRRLEADGERDRFAALPDLRAAV